MTPTERPEGTWKQVPVEPTPKMLAAVRGWTEIVMVAEDATCEYPVSEETLAEAYRAMLAAAPAAPGAAVGVDERDNDDLDDAAFAATVRAALAGKAP